MEQGYDAFGIFNFKREQQVGDFQRKFGAPWPTRIDQAPAGREEARELLRAAEQTLILLEKEFAAAFNEDRSDVRMIRAKLIISETAEVLAALRDRDEIALADGLADLEYVTVGTAVAYSIPLGTVFEEVHRSNMTKSTVGEAVSNHSGDKGKGDGYSPPNIKAAIEAGRAQWAAFTVGDRLATKDGRVIGNSVVTAVYPGGVNECTVFEVLSDSGALARYTSQELCGVFYPNPIGRQQLLFSSQGAGGR